MRLQGASGSHRQCGRFRQRSASDSDDDEDDDEVADELPTGELPPFIQMSREPFKWGSLDGEEFVRLISEVYEEMSTFRKNLFVIPSGLHGKKFIREKAKLVDCWAKSNALERIALKAAAVMDFLLLQRTSPKSTSQKNKLALERRLNDWQAGNISKLFEEVQAIHEHLDTHRSRMKIPQLSSTFAKLVFVGKVDAAIRLLDDPGITGTTGALREGDQASRRTPSRWLCPQPRNVTSWSVP